MDEFLAMLKLYSVQVIMFLAGLNTVLAAWNEAPAWLVALVNIAGVAAHYIARSVPQPTVTREINFLRSNKH